MGSSDSGGSLPGQASALGNLALASERVGELDLALSFHEESLALERKLGNEVGAAITLVNIASIEHHRARSLDAIARLRAAAEIFEARGLVARVAMTLGNIGTIELDLGDLGDFGAAVRDLERALAMKEAIGDEREVAYTPAGLARAHARRGSWLPSTSRQTRRR